MLYWRRRNLRPPSTMTKTPLIFGPNSRPNLGPFEQRLLQELWSRGSATVRELLAHGRIRQAYTTVMTTVDRLYKKGMLDRAAEGRAFRYTPRQTPGELQRVVAFEGIRQLLGSGEASALPLSYPWSRKCRGFIGQSSCLGGRVSHSAFSI